MVQKAEDRIYRLVGDRVASARASIGLSQSKLAKKLGISRVSIVNIEKGRQRPPLHVLWKISEALETELTDLIPTLAQIANTEEGVHLDSTTVSMIEEAASDDPATRRQLTDFIKHARTKLDGRHSKREKDATQAGSRDAS